jgi:hypothetical protein
VTSSSADDRAPGVLSAEGPNRTEALGKYRKFLAEHNAAVDKILADPKWTREAKLEELAARHDKARHVRTQLRQEHAAEVIQRREQLHRQAFGPAREGDRDAWRQAASRATGIEDEDRALVSLQVARKAGDTLWCRALAATGLERGWARVVEQYVRAFPDAAAAVEELTAAGSIARRLEDDMAFSAPTMPKVPEVGPAELEAERRARGGPPMIPGVRLGNIGR